MYRRLGADIAPAHAIATLRAGGLSDTRPIGTLGESNVYRCPLGAMAQRLCGQAQRLQLQGAIFFGQRLRRQHLPGAVKTRVEPVIGAQGFRPHIVFEDPGIRVEADVGVDEGRPANPASDESMHIAAEPKVEQGQRRSESLAGARNLRFALHLAKGRRKIAGQVFASALEHGHLQSELCEPRCRDAAAVPRPDNDGIVLSPHLRGRTAKVRHTLTPLHPWSAVPADRSQMTARMRAPRMARQRGRTWAWHDCRILHADAPRAASTGPPRAVKL